MWDWHGSREGRGRHQLTDSVDELTNSTAELTRSKGELIKSVAQLINFATDLTQSATELINFVAELINSVAELINFDAQLINFDAELTKCFRPNSLNVKELSFPFPSKAFGSHRHNRGHMIKRRSLMPVLRLLIYRQVCTPKHYLS